MRKLLQFLILSLPIALLFIASGVHAIDPSKVDMQGVAEEIVAKGDETLLAYSRDNGVSTGQIFSRLYFDVFETKGMEFALGIYDQEALLTLEMQFSQIMGIAMKGGNKSDLNASWQDLKQNLLVTAQRHQDKHDSGFWSLFWQSLLILLREGFEAMLVITALVTYLRRSGAGDKVNTVWTGVVLALLASILAAWGLSQFTQSLSGARREAMEGVVMLLAAAVLVYVSYWLFAKRETERWQGFIKDKMDQAVGSGSLFMLGLAAFLAVFREGAETILFYQALLAGGVGEGGAAPVLSGFAVASVLLVVMFFLLRSASVRLPLKAFFTVTAAFLFVMAFVFIGKGVLELQVAGWVPTTMLSGFPSLPLLGIFPALETLGAQIGMLILVLLPLLLFKTRRSSAEKSRALR